MRSREQASGASRRATPPLVLFLILALAIAACTRPDASPSSPREAVPAAWNPACEERLAEHAGESPSVYVVDEIAIIAMDHAYENKWGGLAQVRMLTDLGPADTEGEYIGDMLYSVTTWGWMMDLENGGCRIQDLAPLRKTQGENA